MGDGTLLCGNPSIGYDFGASMDRPKVDNLSGGPYAMKRVSREHNLVHTKKSGLEAVSCCFVTMAVVDDNIPESENGSRVDKAVHREAILLEPYVRASLDLPDNVIFSYDASVLLESGVDSNSDGRYPASIQFYIRKVERDL